MSAAAADRSGPADPPYRLDEQVGFVLRQVQQRHAAIFAAAFGDEVTPLQWAAMARLADVVECSQNQLGRLIATDVATIKGVVERLLRRGAIETRPDPDDRRRLLLRLSPGGQDLYRELVGRAKVVTADTLAPLTPEERDAFLRLLTRLR